MPSKFNAFIKNIFRDTKTTIPQKEENLLKNALFSPIEDGEAGYKQISVKDNNGVTIAQISWDTWDVMGGHAAERLFPNLIEKNSKVARITSIGTNEKYQNTGIGTILYLRVLEHINGNWAYNSQVWPDAHKLLRNLSNKGLIEFHSKQENIYKDAGPNIKRITPKGLQFLKSKILMKESFESVSSVYGNDGTYDTPGDARIPKVLGPMLRRRKKPRYRKVRK